MVYTLDHALKVQSEYPLTPGRIQESRNKLVDVYSALIALTYILHRPDLTDAISAMMMDDMRNGFILPRSESKRILPLNPDDPATNSFLQSVEWMGQTQGSHLYREDQIQQ